jgi:CheY-like chemotaxis protein
MGAACCSDKYLVPQARKVEVDYAERESVVAEVGEDRDCEGKPPTMHLAAEPWGHGVVNGVIPIVTTAKVVSKTDLLHWKPHPGALKKRSGSSRTSMENIDPWVLGTMALTDCRHPAQSKEQLLQLTQLRQALESKSDTHTIAQILKYTTLHNWVTQVPFRLEPLPNPDIDWNTPPEGEGADTEDDAWFRVPSPNLERVELSSDLLTAHNTKILQVERSRLSTIMNATKASLHIEKSTRIAALMEAMVAAIDPSLSSRRDDCVFSSVLSSEDKGSQPGARDSSRSSSGRRRRRPQNSRSSSQSSKDSESRGAKEKPSGSPGKADPLEKGIFSRRPKKPARGGAAEKEVGAEEPCTFLICDDNDINCQILTCILGKLCPSKCVITHDGKQAVDSIRAHPANFFRAIFMDIHMPECDGVEATRLIRRLEAANAEAKGTAVRATPIIGVTGDPDQEVKDECLKAGMNRVLQKPTKREDVLDALIQVGALGKKRQPLQVVDVA